MMDAEIPLAFLRKMCIITGYASEYGLVAQLGERSVRIREVEGSNPFRSTKKSCEISYFTAFLQLFEGNCMDANRVFPANFGEFQKD